TLTIDLSTAQSIESSAKLGDDRMILLAQAIATQLNIYNDYNKYGVDNVEPHNLISEAVDWLKATGGVLADGVLSASDVSTSKGKLVLGTGDQTWGPDHTFGSVSGINGEDIANALGWFNQGQLLVSQNGSAVAWGSPPTAFHTNDIDNFWLTLHQVGQV